MTTKQKYWYRVYFCSIEGRGEIVGRFKTEKTARNNIVKHLKKIDPNEKKTIFPCVHGDRFYIFTKNGYMTYTISKGGER